MLANNILRYGRLALDATGYSVVAPLRFVTLGAMAFARGAEAAKEARFKNEETIEKTRVDDINRAEDEAWRIYEAAQLKAGDGEVTSAELNRAFTENLPRDIHNRLMSSEADPAIKTNIATRIIKDLTERWIDSSLWRVQKKLDQAGTEAEKQKILKKYEGKLKDFNRLVGDYGQIDALALGAKISEGAAKGVRMAMTVETLFELPFAAQKIWSDLAGTLGERGEDADILALKSRLVESQSYAAELKSFSDETAESTRNLYAKAKLGINLEDGCTETEAGRIADKIEQLKAEGKADAAKATEWIFGQLKTSDTGKTVAEIIGARQEKLADLYDRALGVDSKDGLDVDEAAKIASFTGEAVAAGRPEELDKVLDVYGGMEVKDAGQTLKDLIRESAPAPETVPAAEPSPEPMPESKSPPEPVPESVTESAPAPQESPVGPASTPETKPGRFENVIDSSQVEGSDSIWKSTREIFIKNAREFGFDAQRDGSLEKWAEMETANAVKELADREYGGKITDLVHAGDKVTIEIGDDGRPRLKFENLSGIKPDYLPEKPETGTDALKATPSAEGIEAPSPSGVEKAEIKTDSLAREYEAIPAGDPRRDEFVYNYIAAEIEKPAYRELKLPHMNKEKLIAFARMFGGGDWARINSPEKLAQTLVEFDNGMKFYTQKLVDGSLDRIFKEGDERALELTHNVFPVEAQDGEIFYAQMQKAGLWQIADSNGDPVELKRPIMGKTRFFGLKKVKNLLGYKSK